MIFEGEEMKQTANNQNLQNGFPLSEEELAFDDNGMVALV